MKLKKLKYILVAWIATKCGVDDLINWDEYTEIVPSKKVRGAVFEGGVNPIDDLFKSKLPCNMNMLDMLKEIGINRTESKPFEHYEAPKKNV